MKRISIGSWAYSIGPYADNPVPWEEILRKLAELGFDGVELGGFGIHPNPDIMPEKAQRDACRQQVADAGLGAVAEIVHLQQTTPDASHHWPFTPEYNQRGHVEIPPILEALEQSHREFANSPLSEVMAPVDRAWLIAEIIPGSTKTETALLDELKVSSEYLHQFVPEEGMTLEI